MFGVYIFLASVTLYRLQGPIVFIYGATPHRQRGGGTVQTRTTRLPPHERSVSQPDQVLPSIDPITDSGKGGVLHQEGGGHGVQVSDGVSEGPGDRAVGVRQGEDVFREGHRSVSVELRESYHETGAGHEPHPHEPLGVGFHDVAGELADCLPRTLATLGGLTGIVDADHPGVGGGVVGTKAKLQNHERSSELREL